MADWRELYTAAVLETDSARLDQYVKEAERAMEVRLNQLKEAKSDAGERQEIANAATALAVLKSERQSWGENRVA